jgi:hypothetical protein
MSKILKNLLAEYGYNVIALPKSDISPLLLLCKDESNVTSLDSPITTLFTSSEQAPPPLISTAVTIDVAASTSVTFDSDTGFSLLSWLLDKLKMGKLDAKLNLDQNKVLTVKYENVQEDKIDLVRLDGYISSATAIKNKFRTYQQKLEDSDLYVVNAVLKSNAFTVTIEDKTGVVADIDATIKGIVSINQNIKRTSDNSITIHSTDETPLAFAFKAQHIFYNKKSFWEKLFNSGEDEGGFRLSPATGVILKGVEDIKTEPLPSSTESSISI